MSRTRLQVGLTDVSQYEHRVGRTGRAGKSGEALLILCDDEARMMPALKDMPIKPAPPNSPIACGIVNGMDVRPPPQLQVRDDMFVGG